MTMENKTPAYKTDPNFAREFVNNPANARGLQRAQKRLRIFGQLSRALKIPDRNATTAISQVLANCQQSIDEALKSFHETISAEFETIQQMQRADMDKAIEEYRNELQTIKESQDKEWRQLVGTEPPGNLEGWMQTIAKAGLWNNRFSSDNYDIEIRVFVMRCRPAIIGALQRLAALATSDAPSTKDIVADAELTVTEAAKLLLDDIYGIDLKKARSRVSAAADRNKFKTNGKKGPARRIDRVSFDSWRLKQYKQDIRKDPW